MDSLRPNFSCGGTSNDARAANFITFKSTRVMTGAILVL